MNAQVIRDVTHYFLGASIILGLHNVKECVNILVTTIRKKSPKSAITLNSVMVAASTFQLLNQIMFILLQSVSVPSHLTHEQGWTYCYA